MGAVLFVAPGLDASVGDVLLILAARDDLSLPLFEATDAIASFGWGLDAVMEHHQALNAAMKREVEHLAALDQTSGTTPAPLAAREQEQAT